MNIKTKRAFIFVVPLAFFVLDRLAKWYALAALPEGRGVVLLSWLKYEFFQNQGLAFSLFSPLMATVVSACAYIALGAYALRHKLSGKPFSNRELFSFVLIALGGASNIYDRLALGGVTDYIIFARSAWNIADIMILAGIALMLKREATGDKSTGA